MTLNKGEPLPLPRTSRKTPSLINPLIKFSSPFSAAQCNGVELNVYDDAVENLSRLNTLFREAAIGDSQFSAAKNAHFPLPAHLFQIQIDQAAQIDPMQTLMAYRKYLQNLGAKFFIGHRVLASVYT